MGLINLSKKFGFKKEAKLDDVLAYRPGSTPQKTKTEKISEFFSGFGKKIRALDPKGLKIAMIIAGVLLLVIAQPAITGYVVKNKNTISILELENIKLGSEVQLMKNMSKDYETQIIDVEKDIAITNNQVESCNKINDDLTNNIKECNSNHDNYKKEMETKNSDLQSQITSKEDIINNLNTQISDLNEEIALSETNYETLGKNTAKNICCTQKIYNSAINSYEIKNNEIYCLSNGPSQLTCF